MNLFFTVWGHGDIELFVDFSLQKICFFKRIDFFKVWGHGDIELLDC
jgi:hypothetical protein